MNHPNTGTILNDTERLKQHVRGSMPKQSIDYYKNVMPASNKNLQPIFSTDINSQLPQIDECQLLSIPHTFWKQFLTHNRALVMKY
jgi:hypothetical protein